MRTWLWPSSTQRDILALQEVTDLRADLAALQAEKADLTTQLGHRVDELMEVTDQLEAEKTAAEQREADLRKVRRGADCCTSLISRLFGAFEVTLGQTSMVPHCVNGSLQKGPVRVDFHTATS